MARGSEEHPCRCFSDVSFHLQTLQTSALHAYETQTEGCSLKGKFIFVLGPAYYFSSLDIYLPGPLKLFGQVILLSDLGVFLVGCLDMEMLSACHGVL